MSRKVVLAMLMTMASAQVGASGTAAAGKGAAGPLPPGTEAPGGAVSESTSTRTAKPAAPIGEDQTTRNAAEISKFVLDQEKGSKWGEKEDKSGSCRVDKAQKTLELTFRADGTLHCKAMPLAEGYKVHVLILTAQKYAAEKKGEASHYLVKATPGADLGSGLAIRGAREDAKEALAFLEQLKIPASDLPIPAWSDEGLFGPWHASDATIQIELKDAGLSQSTKVDIARLYNVNLAVVALGGPGVTEYSVANGAIQEEKPRVGLDYYLGIELFPLAWHRNGLGRLTMGRYFERTYESCWERIALVGGVSLSHPTEKLFVGGAVHVIDGLAITAGWQPRQVQRLNEGFVPGQAVQGTEVPAERHWDTSAWGIGLLVDASVAKAVTNALK